MKKALELIFSVSFGLSLIGGIIIVLSQSVALGIAHIPTLTYFGDVFVIPVCIISSMSAMAAFLLSYTRKEDEYGHSK